MPGEVVKDVLIRLKVQQGAGASQSFKQVASDAQQAGKAVDKVGDAADKAGRKLKEAGAGGIGGGAAGKFSGLAGRLGIGGGGLGAGALPLAALGLAGKLMDIQSQSYGEDGFSAGKFKEGMVRESMTLALFGRLFAQSNEAQALKEKDRRRAELQGLIGRTEQKQATQQPFFEQQDMLRREQARLQTEARIMPAAQAQSAAAAQEATRRSELAQERARQQGRDPREVAAQQALVSDQQQLQIQQTAQLAMIDAQRGNAAGELATKQQAVQDSLRQEQSLRNQLGAAGLSEDSRTERRLQLERQMVETQAAQKRLLDAHGQVLEANKARQSALLQQGRERLTLLEQERARLTGVIATEKERQSGAKEAFGMMSPGDRRRAANLAERLQRGEKVTTKQLEFMGGVSGAETLVKGAAAKRADEGGLFERFARAVELRKPQREAEALRVQIENRINTEITINAKALAEQLQTELVPRLMDALLASKEAAKTALDRLQLQQRNENRAQGAEQ